jgi:radical SAM superfamily enzyme YgiQ (UPF0313 family)
MNYWSNRYSIPVVSEKSELKRYKTVLFSLITWRDFYALLDIQQYRNGDWVAGGNACYNPIGAIGLVDHIVSGDAFSTFDRIISGDRDGISGMISGNGKMMIGPAVDPIPGHKISDNEMILSSGCKRKCRFCINPWRRPYQESSIDQVRDFLSSTKKRGVYLASNSYNDVSIHREVEHELDRCGKINLVLSNSFDSMSDAVIAGRRGESLMGIEGMSERLRKKVGKPIGRKKYRTKMAQMLSLGKNIKTVFQFNLPGESEEDFDEFFSDVDHITRNSNGCSWAISFIPHQPAPYTPMQYYIPRYSFDMASRIMDMRSRYAMGGNMNGVKLVIPQILYPRSWFMQVVAEWVSVTDRLRSAFKTMKDKRSVDYMADHLKRNGIDVSALFKSRDKDFRFPWYEIHDGFTPAEELWRIFKKMEKI